MNTYEQVRDAMPHKGTREAWKDADEFAFRQSEEIQRVQEDETLSVEGKKQQIQQVIDRHAARAQEKYAMARNQAEVEAKSAWEFSIPMPDTTSYANSRIKDASEMLAIQGEAERISEKAKRSLQQITKDASNNPRDKGIRGADDTITVLRGEYGEAMERGGLEGKVKAHAVLKVAEAQGIPFDEVVDEFRSERHKRYARESQEIAALSASIPSGRGLDANPYEAKPKGRRGTGTYRSANKALASGRPNIFERKKRRPAWK